MPPPPPGQHARLAPLVSPIPRASTNFTPRFHSTNSSSLSSSNDRPSPANTPHPPSHPSLSLPRPQSRQTSGPRVIQADPNLANPVRITPVSFRVPREGRSTNAMSSTPTVTPSRDPPVKVIPSVPLPLNKRPSTRDDTRWNPLPRSRTTSMSTMSQLSRDHFAPLEPMTVSPTTNSTQHSSHNAPSTRPMPHTRIPPRTQFIFSNSSPSPNYTSPLSPTPSNRPSFSPIVSKHLPPTDAQASLRPHVEEIPTKAAQAPPIRARKLTLQTTAEALGTSQRPILVEVRPENVTSQASTVHLGEPVRSPYLGPRIVSPILPRSSTSPPVSPAVPRPSFKLDWESKWEEAKKRWDEEDRALREGFTRAAQNTQTGFKARCDSPSPTSFSSSTGRQTPKYEWSVPVPNVLGGSRTHSRASSDPRPQLSRQASSYYGSDVQEDSSSISSSRASLSSSSSSTSSSSSFDSSSSFTSASDESAQAPRSRSNTFPREEEKAWERLFVLLDDLWDGDRTRGTMAADPSVGKAWESYESRWDKLTSQPLSEPLTFTDIPWPVSLTVVPASDRLAQTLNVRNIRNFLLSPSHSKGKGKKERVKTALLRWHNDKFEGRWMKQVQEEHRALVKEAVGLVSRSLNEIMTSLNEGGA